MLIHMEQTVTCRVIVLMVCLVLKTQENATGDSAILAGMALIAKVGF